SIYEQINFLDTKNGQWSLSKHLLKSYEVKHIFGSDDKVESFRFYKFCYEWYLFIPFSHQETTDLNNYTSQLLNYCPNDEKASIELWIHMMRMRRELKLVTSQGNIKNEEFRKKFKEDLVKFTQQADAMGDKKMINKSRLLSIQVNTFTENFDAAKAAYKELGEIFEKYPTSFVQRDRLIADLYHAQTLYHENKFSESFALYVKVFESFTEKQPLQWFMYYAEYMHVSLLTEQMEIAKEICYDFFGQFSDDINGSMYISSTLQMIKYFLFAGETERALKFIGRVEKHIFKTTLLQFQLSLRELTIAYYYLSGNYKVAVELAEKNLKFLRFKKIHLQVPEYTFHSRLVKAICRSKKTRKPLSKNEMEMMEQMQIGTMAQYGYLLKRLYEKTSVK
ncbi:MAG: hypothetical protein ACKVPJ_06215, partial [Chitinophagales bacterium]